MISFLVKKVQSCGERYWLKPDPAWCGGVPPSSPTTHCCLNPHTEAPQNHLLTAPPPRSMKGFCPHFFSQENNKAAKPIDGLVHHPYLISFQLLMSEDCLLVTHSGDLCLDSGTGSQSPPVFLGPHRLPGCCSPVSGQISLPWLSPAHPPHHPQPGWDSSYSQALWATAWVYVHRHQGKEKGAGRSQGSPQWGDHTRHHQWDWGCGAPLRDGQGGAEDASTIQVKFSSLPTTVWS